MKLFKSLFIFLIGMMSLTVLASTSHQEQKQKTELVKGFVVQINAVKVEDYKGVVFVTMQKVSNKAQTLDVKSAQTESITLMTIDDVGWQNSQKLIINTFYKEKLSITEVPNNINGIRDRDSKNIKVGLFS